MPTSTSTRAAVLYAVLVIFTLSGVASAYFDWQAGKKTGRSDEITRCVTGYRLRYVDGPEADALGALADDGTDSAAFQKATDVFQDGKAKLAALNRQARLEPEAFLHDCRERNP